MTNLELCQQYFPNLSWAGENDGRYFTGTIKDLDYWLQVMIEDDGWISRLICDGEEINFVYENGMTLKACLRITKRKWTQFAELHLLAAGGNPPQPDEETIVPTPQLITVVRIMMANKAPTEVELAEQSGVDLPTVERFLAQGEVSRADVLDIFDALNIDEAIALKLQGQNQ